MTASLAPTFASPDPDHELPLAVPAAGTSSRASRATCLHCGASLTRGGDALYCCLGCRLVRALIEREGLARYYDLRGKHGQPVPQSAAARDHRWLEPIVARIAAANGASRIDLDVQGLNCSACVWLIERSFERTAGGAQIVVNPAVGRMHLVVTPSFALDAFVDRVEGFGYRVGPPLKQRGERTSDTLFRMGICIALAMNAMLFAFARYAGLGAPTSTGGDAIASWSLHRLFVDLEFGLATLSVVVGGPVFFRRAWHGLSRGLLHLDLPISLGILLAFASSTVGFFTQAQPTTFFDTLSVFVALMLVGRVLQERVIEKNRQLILESDGADGLLARRLRNGRIETVACKSLESGDIVVLSPHDLLPVDATLESAAATFALDWINGESQQRTYHRGDVVAAGASSNGDESVMLCANQPFSQSPLVEMLKRPANDDANTEAQDRFWQTFARHYVLGVLVVAALAFGVAWMRARDLSQAVSIVTAVLIVTCPCAFGIATPLAYELVLAGLRRRGLFVRRVGFLDRAAAVRRVVFDKTGTLTTGALVVTEAHPLGALAPAQIAALYDLAARSTHPKSVALTKLLDGLLPNARLDPSAAVRELAGVGVSLVRDDLEWRLGDPAWVAACPGKAGGDLAFGTAGRTLASFQTDEELRPDAAQEVRALGRDGLEVWIASGDSPARVATVAAACGVAPERAFAGQSPADKLALVRSIDHRDTLVIGDGINDGLAVSEAFCGGTPAIDRPFMAAKSDFYFVTPGLAPIRAALRAARTLRRTIRLNLAMALAYNAIAVSLAVAGRMSPLLCAVLMPLSSISSLATTTLALAPRRLAWTS